MSNDEPEIIDAEIVEDDHLPAVIEHTGHPYTRHTHRSRTARDRRRKRLAARSYS